MISQDLARQLKEHGFPQTLPADVWCSDFYTYDGMRHNFQELIHVENRDQTELSYDEHRNMTRVPTAFQIRQEIAKIVPTGTNIICSQIQGGLYASIASNTEARPDPKTYATTEVESLARLYCLLA